MLSGSHIRRRTVDTDAQTGGLPGIQPLSQQRGDYPGQDIAHATTGHTGIAIGTERHASIRGGNQTALSFQHHNGAALLAGLGSVNSGSDGGGRRGDSVQIVLCGGGLENDQVNKLAGVLVIGSFRNRGQRQKHGHGVLGSLTGTSSSCVSLLAAAGTELLCIAAGI